MLRHLPTHDVRTTRDHRDASPVQQEPRPETAAAGEGEPDYIQPEEPEIPGL